MSFPFWFQDQKLPSPPAYVFMIDVSYQSMQCGMVRMLMREINEMLNHLPKWVTWLCSLGFWLKQLIWYCRCSTKFLPFTTCREPGQEHSPIKVGFVTYSKRLHFYNIKVISAASTVQTLLQYMNKLPADPVQISSCVQSWKGLELWWSLNLEKALESLHFRVEHKSDRLGYSANHYWFIQVWVWNG